MGYSPWGYKERDTTERLTLSVFWRGHHLPIPPSTTTTKSKVVGITDRESGVPGGLLTTILVIQAPWVLLGHRSGTPRPSRITLRELLL